MKKTIAILITILIISNIITPYIVEAEIPPASDIDYGTSETVTELDQSISQKDLNTMFNDGTASVTDQNSNSETQKVQNTTSFWSGAKETICRILLIVPMLANWVMSLATTGGKSTFTIESTLTNKYNLFDINFYKQNQNDSSTMIQLKSSVSIWYVSIRNIALIGMVVIAVYIGIRMATSLVAEEKAKYKKMLTSWLVGILMLFTLHYVVIFAIKICETFTLLIEKAMTNTNNAESFETAVMSELSNNLLSKKGTGNTIIYLLLYTVFTYYEAKFFIIYLSRAVKIYFYMIISPLVCMTYSIDKIKDNRSQAFNSWTKEMAMEIFMQPIQLTLYMVFIYSAGEIMKTNALIAVLFLSMLGNGEKVIRKLLKVDKGMGKGLSDIKFK